ncbi:hypothetical protein Pth03_63660 [Planotetraspora thailandica]|uniref:Uncharacterized protein n=1 Tax=Planotetraspora thailandica TaxID=487172 RepID=A0A8J3V5Y2_9ACTN|nr:hypothetical protein [Planotetraspora thailandica]GII57977.1 hypothetical protein Pth03_63660 [Planotetraspora thailandica]
MATSTRLSVPSFAKIRVTAAAPPAAGHMTGGDAVRLAVSALLSIVAPMAAGVWRAVRKDVA